MSLRLGSQYVALARRAVPRCRAARIDSISIFAAGHDGAMRHIVNLALFTVIHVVYNTHLNVCLLQLYRRTGDTKECDSSGFEHVFVGETRGEKEVIGFHNWIQFYLQEKAGHVDYQGYILGTKVCGTSPLPQFHEDYVLHCSLKREQSLTC